MTAGALKTAGHRPPSLDPSGAPVEEKERIGAEDAPDEEDWAITPVWLPLAPMILTDPLGKDAGSRLEETAQEEMESVPTVLTVDELATLLRVNRKTVYEALSRGEVPGARRIGATYRILRDAALEWLAEGQDRVSRSRRNR